MVQNLVSSTITLRSWWSAKKTKVRLLSDLCVVVFVPIRELSQISFDFFGNFWPPKLCCISLHRCCFRLKTRVIIKISTHPCDPINVDWFFHEDFFLKKKNQNGPLKKTEIFNSLNSPIFFANISGIGLWISSINWWEGH